MSEDHLDSNLETEEGEEEGSETSPKLYNEKYVQRLKNETLRWKARAKENKDLTVQFEESERRLKEAESKSQEALSEINKIKTMADQRMINAEIRSLATEMGLKKMEYAKLGDLSKIAVSDGGEVLGVREMLEALKTQDPDLFKMPTTTNVNKQYTGSSSTTPEKKKIKLTGREYDLAKREFLRNNR